MAELIVLKFGGTSVESADAMRRVTSIVSACRAPRRLVVTSACGGVTDLLVELADCIASADRARSHDILQIIRDRHESIASDLSRPGATDSTELLEELEKLCGGLFLLGELTSRSRDLILSFGERLSSALLNIAMMEGGLRSRLLDSRDILVTDSTFGEAEPQFEATRTRAEAVIVPAMENGDVVLTQGFIGATSSGETTTIGRGGSDHSAAILGAALGAARIEIWTDVDGVMTADPRVVENARPVPMLSFTEARELARFGAKVLHPETIIPAVRHGVPVAVRNTRRPDHPGTTIVRDGDPKVSSGIHALTLKRGLLAIHVCPETGNGDTTAPATMLRLLAEDGQVPYAFLSADTRAVALVDQGEWSSRIERRLRRSGLAVDIAPTAVLGLVGSGLRIGHGTLLQPLSALSGLPIGLVMAGTSDHLVLLQVPEDRVAEALQLAHRELFDAEPESSRHL